MTGVLNTMKLMKVATIKCLNCELQTTTNQGIAIRTDTPWVRCCVIQ